MVTWEALAVSRWLMCVFRMWGEVIGRYSRRSHDNSHMTVLWSETQTPVLTAGVYFEKLVVGGDVLMGERGRVETKGKLIVMLHNYFSDA